MQIFYGSAVVALDLPPDIYPPKETTAYIKYLHCLIGRNVLFNFDPRY